MSETKAVQVGGNYFPSVKKAKQALMNRADEIVSKYLRIADMATAAGNFDIAADIYEFLIEHMPKEDGESIIAESAAKQKVVETGRTGPIIQIGLKVGGTDHKSLPEPAVITVDVDPVE